MIITDIKRNSGNAIGHVGLALIGVMTRISGLDTLVERLGPKKQPQIKESEIFRALAGLISQGKTDFDHVREYTDDDFFATSLGLSRIPSAEILRQRFQASALNTEIAKELPRCSVELWKRTGMTPVRIEVRIDDGTDSWGHFTSSKEPGNGTYFLNHKGILRLLKQIHVRGHEIGVLGTYQTYQDVTKACDQKKILEKTLSKVGINQDIKGNRQHYLRWDSTITPDVLDESGFAYDTTGSFADRPGFRYGVSKEFSMWGWKNRNRLNLKQRPLIVMECSVLDAPYMNLGHGQKARDLIHILKKRSLAHGGIFTLLWHNSHLKTDLDRELFLEAISLA